MKITLYNNLSDSNVVGKNKGTGTEINLIRIIDTSIENPSFLISGDAFENQNYLFCDELNRYYYINNVTRLQGGLIQLDCSVDVLESYKEQILNLTCIVARQQNIGNGYLYDNVLPTYAYEQIICKRFPNAIQNDSVVLMTIG